MRFRCMVSYLLQRSPSSDITRRRVFGVPTVAVWKDAVDVGEGVIGFLSSEGVGGESWLRVIC